MVIPRAVRHSVPLDCARLPLPGEVRLSGAELRRVEPLQDVLLRPLDHPTVDAWRAAVNEAAKLALGGDTAMFQLPLEGVAMHFSAGMSPRSLSAYSDLLPDLDRVAGIAGRMSRIDAGNRSILWAEHLEWLYGSDYFHELVVPQRAFDPVWVSAPVPGSSVPAALHTYRDRPHGPHFGAAEVQMMRLVRPALEAGIQIVARTASTRASLTSSLDEQRDGALVYDLEGRLLHRSRAVDALVTTHRDERELRDAGAEMARGLGGADPLAPAYTFRRLTSRTGEYELRAVRISEGVFSLRPAVLVTVGGGPPPLPGCDALRERFGLTRRQAEIALLLAQRKTNLEIAEELCISPHTARHHTEAAMSKLRVRDRRDVEARIREAEKPA